MKISPTFYTNSLQIRPHTMENLLLLFQWCNDPHLQDLTCDNITTRSLPVVRERLERWIAGGPTAENWALHLKSAGTPFIGFLQIVEIDHFHGTCKFSLVIGAPEHWGIGYGREVVNWMCRHCFEDLQLHRIGCEVFSHNERSIRLLSRAGFVREGLLRESIRREVYLDQIAFGILRREWQSLAAC